MSNDDQLDDQLRRMAERSMTRRAAAVDTDAALSDHRARVDRPRSAGGRDRRWLALAASFLVVVAGIAAIAWPRSESDPDLVATETDATETVVTSPPTTSDVSTTSDAAPETTTTSIPLATSGSASPDTVRAGGTTEIAPAGSVERTCRDVVTLTSASAGETLAVGQIVNGDWVPAPSNGAPVTYPACEGTTSDEAVSVTVPADVPAGMYDVCITEPSNPAGCAPITITPAATDGADCTTDPLPPPSLVDGTPPGDGMIEEQADGIVVRWGGADSPFAVTQSLGFPIDESWLDNAVADGRAITAGDWQATTVAVGDPPLGAITIYLRNTADGCVRAYNVGPGLFSDQAATLAETWVTALSTGEPVDPADHSDIGSSYFGRRTTPSAEPFFAIDELDATGSVIATLSDEQIAALFSRKTLSDGTSVRLDGNPSQNRCTNRPLILDNDPASNNATTAVNEARSIAVTTTGTLLATRDVCPPGTTWGDPGSFSELIEWDPTASDPTVVSLRTWESDPDQIVFEDSNRVIALGEHTLDDVSPDGRYIALSELYESDSRRWSLIDRTNDATTITPTSTCENAGDIVGPPRFVDNDVVVIARLCATNDTGTDNQGGDVQIEAVELATAQPGGSVVWNSSVPGLRVNEFTRTVDLSARQDTNNTITAIVAGNGGLEISSQSFALRGDDIIEITRPGYQTFACDAADLITQFDTPPT